MSYLLRPLTVRGHIFHNRLISPPICIGKAEADGRVSDALISHYQTLSQGGRFSLVLVPDSFVSQDGRTSLGQLSSASDDMIEGLATLAATIKASSSKTILQLNHAGSCTFKKYTGSKPVGPSEIANPRKGEFPRALETSEVKLLADVFADAALRGKKAGFDGVEIHCAHSYLLSQFYSPLTNKREGIYGGSLENRIRLHNEIIMAIRDVVGDNFLISLRFGALDYMENGSTLEDAITAAMAFEKSGVDLLSISGGLCGYINPFDDKPGYFSEESKAIKESTSTPVILTGGVRDHKDVEKLLEYEACDMVGVGRAVLEGPNWGI